MAWRGSDQPPDCCCRAGGALPLRLERFMAMSFRLKEAIERISTRRRQAYAPAACARRLLRR